MADNSTCVRGNGTTCPASGSTTGLAVGLPLFFLLLLVIVAALIVYKYHGKMRNVWQLVRGQSQEKEEYKKTPKEDMHQYTSRQESVGQTPIYENYTRSTKYDRRKDNQSSSAGEHEEDVYLQCDLPDDAIYSNDPVCSLSIHAAYQEEDVYVVPDS